MSKLDQLKALGDAKRAARNSSGRSLAGGATSDLARVGKGASQRAEQRPSKTVQDMGSVSVDRMQEAPERQAPRQEKGSTPLESTKSKRSRGRPKIEGPREWERQGISRTTYYRERRKKEQGK
jgi:hypothetical protein